MSRDRQTLNITIVEKPPHNLSEREWEKSLTVSILIILLKLPSSIRRSTLL